MEVSKHLDKIKSMGFDISIDWNSEINIWYNANDIYPATAYSAEILHCAFYQSKTSGYSFEQVIESCCDAFYAWYNKNVDTIKYFDKNYNADALEKLESCTLGDITKQIARDLNLVDVLEVFAKYDRD